MADYASLCDRMDAQVDAHLGDRVFYKRQSDDDFFETRAFIIFDTPDGGGMSYQDPRRGVVRLKILRTIVPDPSLQDRVRATLLDHEYRPIPADKDRFATDGRHWLIDLQKV